MFGYCVFSSEISEFLIWQAIHFANRPSAVAILRQDSVSKWIIHEMGFSLTNLQVHKSVD